jgi:hypothetical protein
MPTPPEIDAFEKSTGTKLAPQHRQWLTESARTLFDGDFEWELVPLSNCEKRPDDEKYGAVRHALKSPYNIKNKSAPFYQAAQWLGQMAKADKRQLTTSNFDSPEPTSPLDPAQLDQTICMAERPYVGWLMFYHPHTGVVQVLQVGTDGEAHLKTYGTGEGQLNLAELARQTKKHLQTEAKKKAAATAKRAARARTTQKPLQIPKAYAAFAKSWKGGIITDKAGRDFRFHTLKELAKKPTGKSLPPIAAMQSWAKIVREAVGDLGLKIPGTTKTLLPEELAEAACVGDENGDPLFFNPTNDDQLLLLNHDGMDLEVVTKNFDKWIKSHAPTKATHPKTN